MHAFFIWKGPTRAQYVFRCYAIMSGVFVDWDLLYLGSWSLFDINTYGCRHGRRHQ